MRVFKEIPSVRNGTRVRTATACINAERDNERMIVCALNLIEFGPSTRRQYVHSIRAHVLNTHATVCVRFN